MNPVGSGGTVGVDQIPLPKFTRPTICINANDLTAPLRISTSSVIVEGLSVYNSSENTIHVTGNAANTIIRRNFVGVLPTGLAPTNPNDRNTRMGIQVETNQNNIIYITYNYVGHNGRLGINGGSFTSEVVIEFNEVFESNWYGANAHDGIDVNGLNSTVRYNLVYNTRSGNTVPITASVSGSAGIELGSRTPTLETNYLIENNTCFGNEGPGINVINGCTRNIIRKNICYNNRIGVSVTTRSVTDLAATAFITMNSIYNNTEGGIDINHTRSSTAWDGITTNETASSGTPPYGNNRQKYPVISQAFNQSGKLHIIGSLSSEPNRLHRIEIFSNSAKDLFNGVESDFGEGEIFLFAFDVTTNSSGMAQFSVQHDQAAPANHFISSTATDMTDMVTSEFSPVLQVVADPIPPVVENFFPATGYGTLGFEDLWPAKGDYDFNDLVIDYRFKVISNASNKVESLTGTFIIKAFGASFENGFGFQLPPTVNATKINVTGFSLKENYINLNSNGTEAGQSKATIIVFDNAFKQMQHPGIGIGVNTERNAPFVTPDTIRIQIAFEPNAVSLTDLDIGNFNPFMIVNKNRGIEVHLPEYPPTDLVNPALLGTLDDSSNPSIGRYYKTLNGLPFAINIYHKFDYPIEKVEIINAHLRFSEWATSGGQLYPDWYLDKPGYRNSVNIY